MLPVEIPERLISREAHTATCTGLGLSAVYVVCIHARTMYKSAPTLR